MQVKKRRNIINVLKNQIGCGYCINEVGCPKRDPKINKAKQGCKEYEHHLFKTIKSKK